MNRFPISTLACCLLFLSIFAGCAPSAEQRLEGDWVFWHSAMMDGSEAQRNAATEHHLERYSIVFHFKPGGVLEVTGDETGEGTWKVINASGESATVELKFADKAETFDIKMPGSIAIEFQRPGQDVPYVYTRPMQ